MVRRGDVVLVAFPYTDGTGGKVRPVLVVQGDSNNQRLRNTVVAMITRNTRRAGREPTQFLIDKEVGVVDPSAVKCEYLYTVVQSDILRTVGATSPQSR